MSAYSKALEIIGARTSANAVEAIEKLRKDRIARGLSSMNDGLIRDITDLGALLYVYNNVGSWSSSIPLVYRQLLLRDMKDVLYYDLEKVREMTSNTNVMFTPIDRLLTSSFSRGNPILAKIVNFSFQNLQGDEKNLVERVAELSIKMNEISDILSLLSRSNETSFGLAWTTMYNNLRCVKEGNEYPLPSGIDKNDKNAVNMFEHDLLNYIQNNHGNVFNRRNTYDPKLNNNKPYSDGGWEWRKFGKDVKYSGDIKERVSLNVYPSVNLIKALDAILEKDKRTHIVYYKTPKVLYDSNGGGWCTRHDPITIYATSFTKELLEDIKNATTPYLRQSKEVEKIQTQNPYGVDLPDCIYFNPEVTKDRCDDVYKYAEKVFPGFSEKLKTMSFGFRPHNPYHMSAGQLFCKKKIVEGFENVLKDKRISPYALASSFFMDSLDKVEDFDKNNPDYNKNMQKLVDVLKKKKSLGENALDRFVECIEKYGYDSSEIKKFAGLANNSNTQTTPVANVSEAVSKSGGKASQSNGYEANLSEKSRYLYTLTYVADRFDKLGKLGDVVLQGPAEEKESCDVFLGKNRINDESAIMYENDANGEKSRDTFMAKDNSLTITHPRNMNVAEDSVFVGLSGMLDRMVDSQECPFIFNLTVKTDDFAKKLGAAIYRLCLSGEVEEATKNIAGFRLNGKFFSMKDLMDDCDKNVQNVLDKEKKGNPNLTDEEKEQIKVGASKDFCYARCLRTFDLSQQQKSNSFVQGSDNLAGQTNKDQGQNIVATSSDENNPDAVEAANQLNDILNGLGR